MAIDSYAGGGMNVDQYLARIGLKRSGLKADEAALRRLQQSHLLAVPFENLDIHWQRPITLDIAKFENKIVARGRGGFCYELNGLFNELLRELGFRTRLVSAGVFNGTAFGPEYDHAALIVTIGEDEYLTDVGFGDFAAQPLRFVLDEEQSDSAGKFIIRQADDGYFEVAKRDDGGWKNQYRFRDIGRDIAEFAEMCDFQQYAPDSHFRKGKVCSILTETGRKTLTDKTFIVTANGTRTETTVESEGDVIDILRNEFAISPS